MDKIRHIGFAETFEPLPCKSRYLIIVEPLDLEDWGTYFV